jgi:hypothetical protein
MEMLPPYLMTDFAIFRAIDRSWGRAPLVRRFREKENDARFGAMTLLRLPRLEPAFELILAAYNAKTQRGTMAMALPVIALAANPDAFDIDEADTDLRDAVREYLERAALTAIEKAQGECWKKPGGKESLYGCLRDHLLISGDKDAAAMHGRLVAIGAERREKVDRKSTTRTERKNALRAALPHHDVRNFIDCAKDLLRPPVKTTFDFSRNGPVSKTISQRSA